MLSADEAPPCDRPNSLEGLPSRAARPKTGSAATKPSTAARTSICTCRPASAIDPDGQRVVLEDGRSFPFHKLLLGHGRGTRPAVNPGAELERVRVLRTLRDSRAIIERAKVSRRAVVVGASSSA